MLAWIIHHTGDTVSARGIMVQDEARWFMFQLFGGFLHFESCSRKGIADACRRMN